MRSAARRSAATVPVGAASAPAAISAAVRRSVAGPSSIRSKRLVYSRSAASPRVATCSMISATTVSTSAALSRLAASNAAKAVSNPVSRVWRVMGIAGHQTGAARRGSCGWMDRVAQTIDPAADLFRPRFQRRAVDDQPGCDVGDMLDLDQSVGRQRGAGLHQIDDVTAETELWRQLDRAVELDALGLNAASREMPPGNLGIFCRDPDMAPAPRILLAGFLLWSRDRHTAMADIEVERRIDFGVVEFHQHVVPGDAELRRAERDKARNIETVDADKVEPGIRRREAQFARLRIGEGRFGFDSGAL